MIRERDRAEFAAFRADEERLAREAEEARMRPVREAAAALASTHRKLVALERRTLSGEVVDHEPFVTDDVRGLRFAQAEAVAMTTGAFGEFLAEHPDFYDSDANVDAIVRYFQRNGIRAVSAPMIAHVVERMAAAGLLESAPEPPAPVLVDPTETTQPNAPVQPPVPVLYPGIDPLTGEPKSYTPWQVERMSSEQFKLCRIRF